ncbi:MAG TPA: hypothetical protein VKR06_46325 [Ktedonosporobacter sp.]|nr:hypothetical protein [Ktedonosporobacter sp.]
MQPGGPIPQPAKRKQNLNTLISIALFIGVFLGGIFLGRVTAVSEQWNTIVTFEGQHSDNTALFTVPNEWSVSYTCEDMTVTLTVYAHYVSGQELVVNAPCDATSLLKGTDYVHGAGSVYLEVQAAGPWSLTIQGWS